jgi:hypothetical protein
MAECPRCSQPISQREIVQCAHEVCSVPAVCRVKTLTGWANFCLPHYERYHCDLAHEGLESKGLERLPDETKAEHTARLRAWFRAHAKLKTFDDAVEDRAA